MYAQRRSNKVKGGTVRAGSQLPYQGNITPPLLVELWMLARRCKEVTSRRASFAHCPGRRPLGLGEMVGRLGPGVLHGARARRPSLHIPYLPLTPPLRQPAACCRDHTALATACSQPGPRKSLQFVAPCRPSAGLCRFSRRAGLGAR